jgi:hypothetical protein
MVGATKTWVGLGLLDSGSDDTVFPDHVAAGLGTDLSQAPAATASGIGLIGVRILLAEVVLRITDGQEFREWAARVGFTATPMKRALLGHAGVLQFFTAAFHGDREEVELTVNRSYPGT